MVTVSGFAALPSLSAAVACRFGMRSDVECFSLSGHGCPGGLVGVGLTQQLLLVRGCQLHCMFTCSSMMKDIESSRR